MQDSLGHTVRVKRKRKELSIALIKIWKLFWSFKRQSFNSFDLRFRFEMFTFSESPNPCAVQTTGPLVTCLGGNSCGSGYYCHSGAAQSTQVCCPKPCQFEENEDKSNFDFDFEAKKTLITLSGQSPDHFSYFSSPWSMPTTVEHRNRKRKPAEVCLLLLKSLIHLIDASSRWYFNPLTQQCQTCVYKGLQGNENNFVSRNDCENACVGENPTFRFSICSIVLQFDNGLKN